MAIAIIASGNNNASAGAADIYTQVSLVVQPGDVLVTFATWNTTAATCSFSDNTYTNVWTTVLPSTGSSGRYRAIGYHVVQAGNAALQCYANFTNGGNPQNVPNWSCTTVQLRGAHASPYVAPIVSTTASSTSISANSTDPGSDGGIILGFLTAQSGAGFTAGSGFTLVNGATYGYVESKSESGAGAVTTAGSVVSSSNLSLDIITFKNPVGASPQRIKVTSLGNSMQSKSGIGGYVWSADGTARLKTFSGLSAQPTLSSGNSILYIDAAGLGLSNGTHVLVSAYNSTEGTVGLADAVVEAGVA